VIAGKIDEGMRSGIPEDLWKIVVTVYDDAEKIINFTGNEDPSNARVVVLDKDGKVRLFHDRGFSVNALNNLSQYFQKGKSTECL
jgi:predicted transcriptional regulator